MCPLLQVWDAVVALCVHAWCFVLFLLNIVMLFLSPPPSLLLHIRDLQQTIQIGVKLPTDNAALMKNLGDFLVPWWVNSLPCILAMYHCTAAVSA